MSILRRILVRFRPSSSFCQRQLRCEQLQQRFARGKPVLMADNSILARMQDLNVHVGMALECEECHISKRRILSELMEEIKQELIKMEKDTVYYEHQKDLSVTYKKFDLPWLHDLLKSWGYKIEVLPETQRDSGIMYIK